MMSTKITKNIYDAQWEDMDRDGSPFLSLSFFKALEDSQSVGADTGWEPIYFKASDNSALFTFEKRHSYGEYIFDWDWANFYHKYNIPYYPKLTSMIPFTSVTTSHLLGDAKNDLMDLYENYYHEGNYSSSHFLFLQEDEIEIFREKDYLIRDSFQYHFFNKDYENFEHFLTTLKNKKAKQIRKERHFDDDIKFQKITGDELTAEHASEMYQFYLSTIQVKNAIPYLKEDFFIKIFETLKERIYFVRASRYGEPLAGALFFLGHDRLYGRYWGAFKDISNLHFELCYYQGIDICLKHNLKVFEAGAQGEHKISRGFRPIKTYSAHKFKHPEFHKAIARYILDERDYVNSAIDELSKKLPFK